MRWVTVYNLPKDSKWSGIVTTEQLKKIPEGHYETGLGNKKVNKIQHRQTWNEAEGQQPPDATHI